MNDADLATDPKLAERIEHAFAYPFARPACSYLFAQGRMHPLPPDFVEGRHAVVASGSNAAPARLAAKFGDDDGVIPVTRAVLHDFAVVFAGHFTAYGAIPATLVPFPGARTDVWITWLTCEQLTLMHRSEGVIGCREVAQRYDYLVLEGLDLRPERMSSLSKAGAYLSRRMLAPEGQPIRFAEALSLDCSLKAWPERRLLQATHRLLQPSQSFSRFMSTVLRSPNDRQALFEDLTPHTIRRSCDGPYPAIS
ncbi:MAG: hypothetical protein ACRBM6_37705 [Geminicoccales bacterium]